MPIELTPFDESPLCKGNSWAITDEAYLATCVAQLVIGDHYQAAAILKKLKRDNPIARRAALDRQIAAMRVPVGPSTARWHRDGWVFQMISWVAAQIEGPSSMVSKAPQPRMTDKGPDGVMVVLPTRSKTGRIIVCEDKATANPRALILRDVWPELVSFDTGERDGEIVSDVQSLLSFVRDPAKRRDLVKTLLWSDDYYYRVCVTIRRTNDDSAGRNALFAGYDVSIVSSNCDRRRAETLMLPWVRRWMDRFCGLVAVELTALRSKANV